MAETAQRKAPRAARTGLGIERCLRLAQVNTYDTGGGAAKVAWELFTSCRARGHNSQLVVGNKRSSDPDVLVLANHGLPETWSRFWRDLSSNLRRSKRWQPFSPLLVGMARGLASPARSFDFLLGLEHFRSSGTWRLLSMLGHQPDIIHGHNLHGYYFDLRALPWLSQRVPVVLTLHDAWLLSGHCAHSLGCDRWKTGCGRCPNLKVYPPLGRDATAYNWRRKCEIYARSKLYLATPSQWLMDMAEQSILAKCAVETRVIPNGVDLSIFHPGDKAASRDGLGLPQDAEIILFAANGVRDNVWKDYRTMRDAIAELARRWQGEEILFLALGESGVTEHVGKAEVRFVPYEKDAEMVAKYYRAADVYLHAARADTFPTVVLEALACGTPVVATAVGGIPEQVEDSQTGFLVSQGDVKGLVCRLEQVLFDEGVKQNMGARAASVARQRFDLNRQVETYLDWYFEIVAGMERVLSAEDKKCAM